MPEGCQPSAVLTVGVTAAVVSGFLTTALTCPPVGYLGSDIINGFMVCADGIPNMILNVPPDIAFPVSIPDGTTVRVTTASGFSYEYTSEPGVTATVVNTGNTSPSVLGIDNFTAHSFSIDFSNGTEGWK